MRAEGAKKGTDGSEEAAHGQPEVEACLALMEACIREVGRRIEAAEDPSVRGDSRSEEDMRRITEFSGQHTEPFPNEMYKEANR